jgi:serine/threonine-protein kinase
MASPLDLDATVQAVWKTVQSHAPTLAAKPISTIVPRSADPDSAGRLAIEQLAEQAADFSSALALEGTIGEGGMGVVRLATQRSLGRKVAVKTLRTDQRSRKATLKLLREAWITGSLEHPNIAPIHDVRLDADGYPQVVLKRIEGVEWAALLADDEATRARFDVEDVLGQHLDIFMSVCRAVSFAHSRGILHRDLKPENVMIGEFGEVYLLDWGIAVTLHDDDSRLPKASEANEMAGTPAYMAPEMLGYELAGGLSERSDVYLLGAIVYEIVCGEPPHSGHTPHALILSILASEPVFDSDAPEPLCEIARACMRPSPAERWESAERVRLAVRDYLQRRGASELSEQAQRRLERLEPLLAAKDETQHDLVYRLFGECRFGFREALAAWDDNPDARAGLRRLIEGMVDYELAVGDARTAASLLAELDDAPAALVERVEQAKRAVELELAGIAELRRQQDETLGARTRVFLTLVFGVLWVLSPLSFHIRPRWVSRQALLGLVMPAVFLALGLVLARWARESMNKTALNRRVRGMAMLAMAAPVPLTIAGITAGWTLHTLLLGFFAMWGMLGLTEAVTNERRFSVIGLGYWGAMLASAVWPRGLPWFMALAHLVTVVTALVIWNPRRMGFRFGERPDRS